MKFVSNNIMNRIFIAYIKKIDDDDDFKATQSIAQDIIEKYVDEYNKDNGNDDGEYQYFSKANIDVVLDNIEEAINYFKNRDNKLALFFTEINYFIHRYYY